MNNFLSHKRAASNALVGNSIQPLFKQETKLLSDKKILLDSDFHENYSSKSIYQSHPAFHRRSYSTLTQKPTFELSPNPTPPPKNPKESEFLGLLNAANTYFDETQNNPMDFPPCEFDNLNEQISKILEENSIISQDIKDLQEEYKEMCDYIEDQKHNKDFLDKTMQSLKVYNERLELDITQANMILNSVKNSSANDFLKDGSRVQHPSPMPIIYKPISNRMHRNNTYNR